MSSSSDYKIKLLLEAQNKMSGDLKKVSGEIKDMQAKANKASKGMTANFGKMAKAIGLVAVAMKTFSFGKELGSLAISLEQVEKKSSIVLGKFKSDVENTARSVANSMGMTNIEFVKAATNMTDLLVPMKFSREESVKMATETTKLAGALSEWSAGKYTATEASEILSKALLGETEQLKSMGIKIDQTSKAYGDRVKVLMKSRDLTLEQAKALEIQRQIFDKSTDAQNAYKEGAGSLVRQQAQLGAKFKDVKETLAKSLIPAMQTLFVSIAPIITEVTNLISTFFNSQNTMNDMKGVMMSVVGVIKIFKNIIFEAGKGFGLAFKYISEMLSQNGKKTLTRGKLVAKIIQGFGVGVKFLITAFKSTVQVVTRMVSSTIKHMSWMGTTVFTIFKDMGRIISSVFDVLVTKVGSAITVIVHGVISDVNSMIGTVNSGLGHLGLSIPKITNIGIKSAKNFGDINFSVSKKIGEDWSSMTKQTNAEFVMLGDVWKDFGNEVIASNTEIDASFDKMGGGIESTSGTIKELESNSVPALKAVEEATGGASKKAKEANKRYEKMGKSVKKSVDSGLSRLRDLAEGGVDLKDKIKDAGEETANLKEKFAKNIEGIKNKIQGLNDKVGSFKEKFTKSIQAINDKIGDLKDGISEVNKQFAKDTASESQERLNKVFERRKDILDELKEIEERRKDGDIESGDGEQARKLKEEQKMAEKILGTNLAKMEAYDKLTQIQKIEAEHIVKQQEMIEKRDEEILKIQGEIEALELKKVTETEIHVKKLAQLELETNKKIEALQKEKEKETENYTKRMSEIESEKNEYIQALADKKVAILEQIKTLNNLNAAYKRFIDLRRQANIEKASKSAGIQARAKGGPVSSGSPYMVGEKGPELFVPKSNGNIVPNNQITNAPVVNINLGGVSIGNEEDSNQLVSKIKNELTREMELFSMGIN